MLQDPHKRDLKRQLLLSTIVVGGGFGIAPFFSPEKLVVNNRPQGNGNELNTARAGFLDLDLVPAVVTILGERSITTQGFITNLAETSIPPQVFTHNNCAVTLEEGGHMLSFELRQSPSSPSMSLRCMVEASRASSGVVEGREVITTLTALKTGSGDYFLLVDAMDPAPAAK